MRRYHQALWSVILASSALSGQVFAQSGGSSGGVSRKISAKITPDSGGHRDLILEPACPDFRLQEPTLKGAKLFDMRDEFRGCLIPILFEILDTQT